MRFVVSNVDGERGNEQKKNYDLETLRFAKKENKKHTTNNSRTHQIQVTKLDEEQFVPKQIAKWKFQLKKQTKTRNKSHTK